MTSIENVVALSHYVTYLIVVGGRKTTSNTVLWSEKSKYAETENGLNIFLALFVIPGIYFLVVVGSRKAASNIIYTSEGGNNRNAKINTMIGDRRKTTSFLVCWS